MDKNRNRIVAPLTQIFVSWRKIGSFVENLNSASEANYISPLDKKIRRSFLDVADFERVAGIYETADQNREIVIKTSRDIVKGAKKAIYDLHRNQIDDAKSKIKEAEVAIGTLAPIGKVTRTTGFGG